MRGARPSSARRQPERVRPYAGYELRCVCGQSSRGRRDRKDGRATGWYHYFGSAIRGDREYQDGSDRWPTRSHRARHRYLIRLRRGDKGKRISLVSFYGISKKEASRRTGRARRGVAFQTSERDPKGTRVWRPARERRIQGRDGASGDRSCSHYAGPAAARRSRVDRSLEDPYRSNRVRIKRSPFRSRERREGDVSTGDL